MKWGKFDMEDFISWETEENKENGEKELVKKEIIQSIYKTGKSKLSLSDSEKKVLGELSYDFKEKCSKLFGLAGGVCYTYDDDVEPASRIANLMGQFEPDTANTTIEVSDDTTTIERIMAIVNDDETSEVVKYLLLYLYHMWKDEERKRLELQTTNSRLDESYRIISEQLQNKKDSDKFIGEIKNILMTLKNGT